MTGLPVFSVVTPRKCGFRGEIYLICYEHFHREIFSEYREIYDITPSRKGLCSRIMKVKWEICVGRTVEVMDMCFAVPPINCGHPGRTDKIQLASMALRQYETRVSGSFYWKRVFPPFTQ